MPRIPYSAGALDRGEPIRQRPEEIERLLAAPGSRFLCFRDLDVAMHRGPPPDLAWLERRELPVGDLLERLTVFLGIDARGTAHFALPLTDDDAAWSQDAALGFVDARSAGLQLMDERASVVAYARSMLAWHSRRPYCSCCASRNAPKYGGMQLHCTNASCGAVHFPRTDPVVIMLVQTPDGESCLLGRSPHYPAGLVSALAGFVEPGESIEDAVRREIREEAGIECGNCRYFASQPWPFPSTLMIGCFATAVTTDLVIDETELEWARWFGRAEVHDLFDGRIDGLSAPQPIAIAHYLLAHWLQAPSPDYSPVGPMK